MHHSNQHIIFVSQVTDVTVVISGLQVPHGKTLSRKTRRWWQIQHRKLWTQIMTHDGLTQLECSTGVQNKHYRNVLWWVHLTVFTEIQVVSVVDIFIIFFYQPCKHSDIKPILLILYVHWGIIHMNLVSYLLSDNIAVDDRITVCLKCDWWNNWTYTIAFIMIMPHQTTWCLFCAYHFQNKIFYSCYSSISWPSVSVVWFSWPMNNSYKWIKGIRLLAPMFNVDVWNTCYIKWFFHLVRKHVID